MGIKVSIIIPVYNVEKFLRRCLDSCVNQTLKEIEIIVVNDASIDASDIIMQEYERKYPEKIRCFYLKNNIKQGGARNVAIQYARGEYLAFVDSDDWIKTSMCEQLYKEAKRSQSDVVYCNILRQKKEQFLIYNRFSINATGKVDENILRILTQFSVGPVAHIVKKDIIIDNKLYFPEKTTAEDTAITKLWDLYADKISKIEDALYVYCFNTDSTGQAKRYSYYNDEFNCVKLLYNNLMKCQKISKYIKECTLVCMRYALDYLEDLCKLYNGDFKRQIEQGFCECMHYICNNITQDEIWKYWFTPIEIECILDSLKYRQDSNFIQMRSIEDYRQYYKEIEKEIKEIFQYIKENGKSSIGIWGNTVYTKGFCLAFPNRKLVDNLSTADKYEIDAIICLRTTHIENIKKQLCDRNVFIFDLQGYLLNKEDKSRFCYVEK